MIEIDRLTEATQSAADDLSALASELHGDERRMPADALAHMLEDTDTILIVARDGERIIGMATLYVIQKIARRNGILEDVVVSEVYRGQGIGERLVRGIIDVAPDVGVQSITLSSRPVRIAAHKLYEKLGFKKRETDVFRLALS